MTEHWFGDGLTATADGPRGVIVVARRGAFPSDAGWPQRLAAVTGWEALTDRQEPFAFPPAARVAAHWFEGQGLPGPR